MHHKYIISASSVHRQCRPDQTKPDQTRTDQNRSDQTRPDQRRLPSRGPNSKTCVLVYFAPSPFLMIPKDLITSSNPKASDDLIPSDNLIIQWNPINEFDQKGKVLLGEIISLKLDYCYCQINLNWSFNCLPLKLCLCEICKRLSCAVGIGNNCMHLWLLYRHQVQQNNYTNHSCGAQRNLPQFYL